MESDSPRIGEVYRHYKGGHYVVQHFATHSETREQMIVYLNLDHDSLWVRPLAEWMKPIDGQPTVKRFEAVCRKCATDCQGRCYS